MLHIKLRGMEHRAPCKHIFCPYTHTLCLGWGHKFKNFFLKVVVLHIKLKVDDDDDDDTFFVWKVLINMLKTS